MIAVALVALLVLVILNGIFVAAEFALVRSSRGRLEALAKDGKAGVDEVLEQLEKLDEVLAACQLGITMASIGIGFLGEPAIAELLEPLLGDSAGAHATALVISFAIATSLHITIGEQVPKMMAITRPEPAARLLVRPVNWFRVATKPFTWALNRASNGIVRMFGVDPSGLEEKHTSEDVKGIIRHSARGGTLDPGEAIMLGGVFHLHEQEAREVMTPIPAVVTVNANETVEDALQRCVSSGHTRLVAIENDNPDRVRGVVHNNSLARLYMNTGADASIESAIRDVPIVPETKPLDDLLAELQRQRSSIGVVVDEYGRTVGIVTDRGHPGGGRGRDRGRDRRSLIDCQAPCGRRLVRPWPRGDRRPGGRGDRATRRLRRLQLCRRLRLLRARPPAQARRSHPGQRQRDPGRVGPREPHRRRANPPDDGRAPGRHPARDRRGLKSSSGAGRSFALAMWTVRLTDRQKEVLTATLATQQQLGPALSGALEALELARWDDLPDARLPWAEVADQASRQGVSEADVVWDLSGKGDNVEA